VVHGTAARGFSLHALGQGFANRKLLFGFISMKTGLSISAVFTSREGAGTTACAFQSAGGLQLLLVGIANESDQVT